MSEELTLLACPACGEKGLSVEEHIYDRYGLISPWWTVICPNCGLSVGEKCTSSPQAIDAWNALPRALTWTNEPPKVPGWYWCRKETWSHCIVVFKDGKQQKASGIQWAGPIPEPREPK